MDRSNKFSDDMQSAARNALFNLVEELSRVIKEMAAACDPFPSFFGMNSIQAIELEPVVKNDKSFLNLVPQRYY